MNRTCERASLDNELAAAASGNAGAMGHRSPDADPSGARIERQRQVPLRPDFRSRDNDCFSAPPLTEEAWPKQPMTIPALNAAGVVALALAAVGCGLMPGLALAASLSVYGQLPSIEAISLSPSGSRAAFVRTSDDLRTIQVVSLEHRQVLSTLRVGEQKVRGLTWADDHHLLIITSAAGLPFGLVGAKVEWAMLQVYDVARHRLTAVPHSPKEGSLDVLNVISGPLMVRRVDGHTVVFFPGFCLYGQVLPALFRVDIESGYERVVQRGSAATSQWLVDLAGGVIAEQDYYDKQQRWVLKIRRGAGLEDLASGQAAIDVPQILGLGPSADTLLIEVYEDGIPVWRPASLTDGTFGAPMAGQQILEAPIHDRLSHRVIGGLGVSADGDARYVFFEPGMQERWDAVVRAFAGARVSFASASEDFKKVVVFVDRPRIGPRYMLIDLGTSTTVSLGRVYEGVSDSHEVRRILYSAADGLPIPALLTLPPARDPKNLPLVVLPHGGPAARDIADFDWWSQALADQGYAVLRPNYRGSALPKGFLAAGFGEWGQKMQTDLSDGVRYLVREGIADPRRVCIAGASYGGYAALAGVALDPGVYRCAVSVAGMSDLKRMLEWAGENQANRAQRYWNRFMGVTGPKDPALDRISPVRHVDAVNVPVLLIHGRDDTVVPFEQSERMRDALRRAKKNVEFVQLKREDHWLSRSETRLQMLQTSVAFLRTHNPPD